MDSKMTKTLHFNFTPVQSFVAQARRTRDLWAGSYLLAWLSGQAMTVILNDKGEILMPFVDDDLLIQAICKPKQADFLAKSLGTLPNRFSARIPQETDPKKYADIIQANWLKVANAVRERIDPENTLIDAEFWKRQINHHWEFAWVIGEQSSLLDSRKNLRLPKSTKEFGEKCTLCGERQELFDASPERQKSSLSKEKPGCPPERKRSNDWWKKLPLSDLNLREGERLCAVCLTKRVFPLVAEKAVGWDVEPNYPSTAYLSAIDWLEDVLSAAKTSRDVRKAANDLAAEAKKIGIPYSESNTRIQGLSDHLADSGIESGFLDLDGNVFHLSAIDADQLQKKDGKSLKSLSTDEKRKLSKSLQALQTAVGSSTTPFYALLLMDGDGMGKLIGDQDEAGRTNLSKALASFTHQVPDIVKNHNGKLIYAGGDDVFALLPVSTAIDCAAACQSAYRKAFGAFPEAVRKVATISAAVQFAHQKIALSVVVKDAHRLLDDVAKDRSGRDALACRVWKPGGPVLTWSQPWAVPGECDSVKLLNEVMQDFHPDSKTERFSSKFLHKLRHLFEWIQHEDAALDEAAIQDLLIAEYLANREHDWQEKDKEKQRLLAAERIGRLLLLCREQIRSTENQQITYSKGKYNADAALLIRFLVQKEV